MWKVKFAFCYTRSVSASKVIYFLVVIWSSWWCIPFPDGRSEGYSKTSLLDKESFERVFPATPSKNFTECYHQVPLAYRNFNVGTNPKTKKVCRARHFYILRLNILKTFVLDKASVSELHVRGIFFWLWAFVCSEGCRSASFLWDPWFWHCQIPPIGENGFIGMSV